jgi:hypothetical protein
MERYVTGGAIGVYEKGGAEEVMPPIDIRRALNSFGGASVYDAEHSAALLRLSDDDFEGIRGGTENRTHFS